MRVVVTTTLDEPLGSVFWRAYYGAGGLPPSTVMLMQRRRKPPVWRNGLEGVLLFGLLGTVQVWRATRRARTVLRAAPQQIFQGVGEVRLCESLNKGEGFRALEQAAPDLLVSVGSPEIFKPSVLRTPAIGAVNIHNGRLPTYRGLFGTFWEALAGEEWGYTSVHVMAAEVDAGPVLAQGAVRLAGCSLLEALKAKKRLGGRLLAWLVRFVDREGTLPPSCPFNADLVAGYYSWPSLRDMSVLGLRRVRQAIRRAPSSGAPVKAWPAEMALGDS